MKKYLHFLLMFTSLIVSGQSEQLQELFQKAYKYRASYDSGLYYSSQALILSRETRFDKGVELSKMYAGMAYYNAGLRDTATVLLYEALPELDDFVFEKGMAHWYIGKIHVRARDFKNGEEHYLHAMEAFLATDSIALQGDVYNSLGVIQGMQTNYTQALEWFTKAYQLKIINGLDRETSSELNNISLVYMRMGSYDKAIEYVRRSIELNEQDNDQSGYSTLGGIYNFAGNLDSAQYYYEKALSEAKKRSDSSYQGMALSNLSNLQFQQGNFREAILLNRKSLKFRKANKNALFGIYTELGKSYRGLQMIDSASFFLREGFSLAVEQKDKVWARESTVFLSYLLAEQGQFDSAFHYLTLGLAYKDSLNNDRIQEIFADQRVALETAKKQQEIETLQREREVDRYKQRTIIIGCISLLAIGFLGFFNYRSRQLIRQKSLSEEKQLLTEKLEKNQAELSAYTLSMIHRKNSIKDIEDFVEKLEGSEKQKIKSIINVNNALDKDWENFQKYFSQVHATFFEMLRKKFPALSQSEVRLSALIKMNLTNNEIAVLLNIESKSVRMARYRLRKKFNLSEKSDLNLFIHNLE
ncbi:MAG: tetratricopeptide repeat protein [Ekhidna sp.]